MRLKITLLFFLVSFSVFSQSITAKLIDASTKAPIAFANIKTGAYSGTISNDEGYFTVLATSDTNNITISCMGYASKTLSIKKIVSMGLLIALEPASNQLNEVFISNKRPNTDTIIARVNANISKNYKFDLNAYNVFYRATDYVNFKSLEFEIDKASHVKKQQLEGVNKSLTALANQVKSSNMVQFTDFKGHVFTLNKDSIKLKVEKATELLDSKKDFSVENIQKKMQDIILKYLDTTKTYKLKTGLFKIEDSLALNDDDFKEDDTNEYNTSYLNNDTKSILNQVLFYEDTFLNTILNSDLYTYSFKDVGYNNGELTYSIGFTPRKGKAKYTGTLFIAEDTYAVSRIDYNYYEDRHGQKLNLRLILGIKYIENKNEGTIIFAKDSSNVYQPKYIKRTTGSYFYVSRPLKFIENSSNRYKVSFDFKIEGQNSNTQELLVTNHKTLSFLDFQAERQTDKTPMIKLGKYEKTIWDNEGIIAPSLEMKVFDGDD